MALSTGIKHRQRRLWWRVTRGTQGAFAMGPPGRPAPDRPAGVLVAVFAPAQDREQQPAGGRSYAMMAARETIARTASARQRSGHWRMLEHRCRADGGFRSFPLERLAMWW